MLTFAVLSDIHAHSKARLKDGEQRPSFAEISSPESITQNPFSAVEDLIRREGLTADVLISGGDMGDKATPDATTYAWGKIRRLQQALGADTLLAATGNHDMDSRYRNGFDARGILQGLENYPFASEELNNDYWANNFVVQQHATFRSVLLNSSAYHGYREEWQHGRISPRTREQLERRLDSSTDPGLNVLVTHHQLLPFGSIDLTDQSEMTDGSALLELLSSGRFGSWLIIHGHRHWPHVAHAAGGRGSPLVFSAGSFSAVLYDELQDKARNQFYVLELDEISPGHPVLGKFRAWDWVSETGFQPARERSGLPHKGGFGGALNGTQLADQVSTLFSDSESGFKDWSTVVAAVPDLDYTMPGDFEQFRRSLLDQHRMTVLFDVDGTPMQVGRAS